MKKYCLSILMFLSLTFLYAQDCKVLLKTINESYTGDCKKSKAEGNGIAIGTDSYEGEFKKGYPHGYGTYTSNDGSVYKGAFKNGKKEGKGSLIIKADSTIIGFWKKDSYIGLFEKPYKKTDNSQNITNLTLKQIQTNINSIRFYVKKDNSSINTPNLNIIVSIGNYQTTITTREFFEITNVTFPIKAKAYYGQEFVDFEIFNKGLWEVKMEITNIKGLRN